MLPPLIFLAVFLQGLATVRSILPPDPAGSAQPLLLHAIENDEERTRELGGLLQPLALSLSRDVAHCRVTGGDRGARVQLLPGFADTPTHQFGWGARLRICADMAEAAQAIAVPTYVPGGTPANNRLLPIAPFLHASPADTVAALIAQLADHFALQNRRRMVVVVELVNMITEETVGDAVVVDVVGGVRPDETLYLYYVPTDGGPAVKHNDGYGIDFIPGTVPREIFVPAEVDWPVQLRVWWRDDPEHPENPELKETVQVSVDCLHVPRYREEFPSWHTLEPLAEIDMSLAAEGEVMFDRKWEASKSIFVPYWAPHATNPDIGTPYAIDLSVRFTSTPGQVMVLKIRRKLIVPRLVRSSSWARPMLLFLNSS